MRPTVILVSKTATFKLSGQVSLANTLFVSHIQFTFVETQEMVYVIGKPSS